MYDVDGLEKKWQKYQLKRKIPWIASALLIFLAALYLVFRVDISTVVQKYRGVDKPSVEVKKVQSTESMPPQDQVAAQSIKETEEEVRSSGVTDIFHPEILPAKEHKRKYLKIEVTDMYPKKNREEKNSSDFKETKKIESLKESFVKEGKYNTSLRLARTYYKRGDYSEAENWALITNDLNNSVEESWLIFAKSKAKQGDAAMAEKILSSYAKKRDSYKAKELLRKMEEGSF